MSVQMFKLYFRLTLVLVCANALCNANKVAKPNIVMFLTDDQDLVLGGMEPMKNVRNLIANEGAVFTNSFTASPICCPSRATILTGMYPHNHRTVNNSLSGGCDGRTWRRLEKKSFAAILNEVGYETFYAGKYLNQYGTSKTGGPGRVPPGWSDWHGLVGNSVYYNYTLSNNGVPSQEDNQYLTDVIKRLSINYLSSWHKRGEGRPFLMVVAPPAPHQPFTPAPRHSGRYCNVTALKTPSFNLLAENKHWLMKMSPSPLPAAMMPQLDATYRSRWETLLAVDEMVGEVVHFLSDINQIDNTYVIYTSDNGYHIGQFSQVFDKRQPYETDIRVPLVVRGPGIKKKSLVHNPTINIDIAPTILTLAGVTIPDHMDGVAMNFTTNGIKAEFEERNMLIEYYGEGAKGTVDDSCTGKKDGNFSECLAEYACKCQDARNNTFACVRHLYTNIDYKYCLFNDTQGFEEMYSLRTDPYELRNVALDELPSRRLWYRLTLARLMTCRGRSCQL